MSLLAIVSTLEQERNLNKTLLASLIESLDADMQRIVEKKANLIEEFAERDASLARLIDGGTLPEPVIQRQEPEPVTEEAA